MIKIAISGGIGSGKSAVTSILRGLGAKVIVADEINSMLFNEETYIEKIKVLFPEVIHNNIVDKKELAAIVFNNEEDREALMALSHPIIFEKMIELSDGEEIVFYEVPLISRCPVRFDSIWYLDTDINVRIKKVMERDNITEMLARRIVDLQTVELETLDKADVIIKHDYSFEMLKARVKEEYSYTLKRFS